LVTLVTILQGVGIPNLICALAAIIFWSLLICVVSLCYELWRLKHNWRLGMQRKPRCPPQRCIRSNCPISAVGQEGYAESRAGVDEAASGQSGQSSGV
jgi:hypothetical protein